MLIKTADGVYKELRGHWGAIPEELREKVSETNIQRWFEDAEKRRKAGVMSMETTPLDVAIDWSEFWCKVWTKLVRVMHPVGWSSHETSCAINMGHCEQHCQCNVMQGLRAEQRNLGQLQNRKKAGYDMPETAKAAEA